MLISKYKWCVFDLDGTLLNDDKRISDEDINSIKLMQNQGIEIFIASGRTDMFSFPYLMMLNSKTPIISSNGALVRNLNDNLIIFSKFIPKEYVDKFISYVEIRNLNYMAYTLDSIYYHILDRRIDILAFENKYIKNPVNTNYNIICDHSILRDINILKFLIIDETRNIPYRKQELCDILDLEIVSSGSFLLDIMAKDVSKGDALKRLASYYKMDPKKIIAFGDNHNDAEMFKYAGKSIAMGNGVDEIKSIADHITLSNNQNGISYAIKNFIL